MHPFNGLFSRTTWVSQYQKGKTSLELNKAREDGVLGYSVISWTICKQSAPCSRQMTTPTPHHSIFTGRMLFPTPNQQNQSIKGLTISNIKGYKHFCAGEYLSTIIGQTRIPIMTCIFKKRLNYQVFLQNSWAKLYLVLGSFIHVTFNFASILNEIIHALIFQCSLCWRGKYCLNTIKIDTQPKNY